MSHERVLKALVSLGLSRTDAEVYVFLATKGPQKARNIADKLKMNKRQVYRSLKSLRGKGIVSATIEHSTQFSAVPFEKVLDLFKKAKLKEAQSIQRNKEEILSRWHAMTTGNSAT